MTEEKRIALTGSNQLAPQLTKQFEMISQLALKLVKPSSRRVYQHTYGKWSEWCKEMGTNPLSFHPDRVSAFLVESSRTKATRQNMLAHLRSLARMALPLYAYDPQENMYITTLLKMHIPEENLEESDRVQRALSKKEIADLMALWQGDSLLHLRNRTLIAMMFATWARRSEIVDMRWRDINWDDPPSIFIRNRKGGKSQWVNIIGKTAMKLLEEWWFACHPESAVAPIRPISELAQLGRTFIFCPINGRGLGPDKPLHPTSLYAVVGKTSSITEIPFSPHDARRTGITQALNDQVPRHEVQAQAGHAQYSTTARYAQPSDVKQRGKLFRSILE